MYSTWLPFLATNKNVNTIEFSLVVIQEQTDRI